MAQSSKSVAFETDSLQAKASVVDDQKNHQQMLASAPKPASGVTPSTSLNLLRGVGQHAPTLNVQGIKIRPLSSTDLHDSTAVNPQIEAPNAQSGSKPGSNDTQLNFPGQTKPVNGTHVAGNSTITSPPSQVREVSQSDVKKHFNDVPQLPPVQQNITLEGLAPTASQTGGSPRIFIPLNTLEPDLSPQISYFNVND